MQWKKIYIIDISFFLIYSEYIENSYGSIGKGETNPAENGQKFMNNYFKKRIYILKNIYGKVFHFISHHRNGS